MKKESLTVVQKIDDYLAEWSMLAWDTDDLRKIIKKYGNKIAAEAEQIYFKVLTALYGKATDPEDRVSVEFRYKEDRAELSVYVRGSNQHKNDQAIRKVAWSFGSGWRLIGGSFTAVKPNIPGHWILAKTF